MTDEITAILAALRTRYPGRSEEAYRMAALRVHFNLECEGCVSAVDRLFLGGPDGERSDADILIDRTLIELAERDATP